MYIMPYIYKAISKDIALYFREENRLCYIGPTLTNTSYLWLSLWLSLWLGLWLWSRLSATPVVHSLKRSFSEKHDQYEPDLSLIWSWDFVEKQPIVTLLPIKQSNGAFSYKSENNCRISNNNPPDIK